jgi:hypothetical protein
MTKTIVMLGATAAMAIAMATPSFAQSRNNARDAYAQDFNSGYAAGWQGQNMPPQAAALWRPGLCWKDVDRLRRTGYFEACKK